MTVIMQLSARSNLRAVGALVLSLASLAVVVLVLSADGEHEVSLSSFCFFGSCKTPPASAEARWRKEAAKRTHGGIGVPCFMGGACDSPPSTRIRKWKRSMERKKRMKQMEDSRRLKKWGVAQVKVKKHHRKVPQTVRQRQKAFIHDLSLKIQARARFLRHRKSDQITVAKLSAPDAKLNTLSQYPNAQKKLKGILSKLSSTESAKVAADQALKHAQALTKVANKARAGVLSFEKTVTASIAKAKADEKAHKLALLRVQYLEKQSEHADSATLLKKLSHAVAHAPKPQN